eukprot:6604755-Pyramimonas_sp.AAC.1
MDPRHVRREHLLRIVRVPTDASRFMASPAWFYPARRPCAAAADPTAPLPPLPPQPEFTKCLARDYEVWVEDCELAASEAVVEVPCAEVADFAGEAAGEAAAYTEVRAASDIPAYSASDWSIVRVRLRILRLIGPS